MQPRLSFYQFIYQFVLCHFAWWGWTCMESWMVLETIQTPIAARHQKHIKQQKHIRLSGNEACNLRHVRKFRMVIKSECVSICISYMHTLICEIATINNFKNVTSNKLSGPNKLVRSQEATTPIQPNMRAIHPSAQCPLTDPNLLT